MTIDPAFSFPVDSNHRHEIHGFGVFGGVARVTASPSVDVQVAADFVANFLQALADECLNQGADLIGHLKAHLSTSPGTVRASLVDPKAGPSLVIDSSAPFRQDSGEDSGQILNDASFVIGQLTVNAIVHGLTSESVTTNVFAVARLAATGGLSIEWENPPAHRSE
jgi:hypothetical protein